MNFESLSEWLAWLEKSHPKEIDLGLDRIRPVAEKLELIHVKSWPNSPRVITVAGTNGKGSCVASCAALLIAAGYSVGVYTSPHLLSYSERIQVKGVPVADDEICAAFKKIAEATSISLTYFEYGTLAALEIFKQHSVDFMVLEVGLGGRLDAVNILDADVAVITSIALDHQQWLGDTRELIGREKAGILRSRQVFVCADEDPPQTILDVARELKTQSYYIGREFLYTRTGSHWQWQGKTREGDVKHLPLRSVPQLPLQSVAAALQCILLLDIVLPDAVIESTLGALMLAGRFQKILFCEREFILDVAHNPAATLYFSRRLSAEPASGKTQAIVAMMSDKDRRASLANLAGLVATWYLLELADLPRAATSAELAEDLRELNISAQIRGNIDNLMHQLFESTKKGDRILVFGSFHTVAAVLLYMQTHNS
jgi:dihydrofolate synthase / folylpolyglutamate synthase